MKTKKQKRKGQGTKSYGWDNSFIVFGDPFEKMEEKEEKREREKERWQKTKKSKGDQSKCKNYHLKHG